MSKNSSYLLFFDLEKKLVYFNLKIICKGVKFIINLSLVVL